ncbi:MAG: hypothetical protein HW416_1498 [Chloroflexi bacterium]|nr:hypothetical protein [Chloroflexota bacterium]
MRVRGSFVVTLGLVTAFLISACSGADQVRGRIGENIAAGDYHVTVNSMENPGPAPDRFTNPKPGNRFVKFDVTVSNSGQQHLPVASSHFTMRDSGGIDNSAMFGVPTDGGLRVLSLAPSRPRSSAGALASASTSTSSLAARQWTLKSVRFYTIS